MYKKYIEEMTSRTVIETDKYFTEYDIIPGFIRIKHLYILPKYRGKGLFKQIHDEYVERALQNNCKELLLTVDATYENMEKLIKLYSRFGFQVFETDNHICKMYKKVK